MSQSNKLAMVIPVRNTSDSPLSDKGKGVAEVAPDSSLILSDDNSSAAFARMTSVDREIEAQAGALQMLSRALY